MTDRIDNVLDLQPRLMAGRQSERDDVLDATLRQLDELGHQLRRLSPQPDWPPQRWGIDSTAFRVRMAGARQVLSAVTDQDCYDDLYPFRWTLHFDHLRFETEQRLDDIQACICALQRPDVTPAERTKKTTAFMIGKPKLLQAIGEVQRLIVELLLLHST